MLQYIFICIGLFVSVYSLPISEEETSKLISLFKQPESFDILALLMQTNEGHKTTLEIELFELVKKEFEQFKLKFSKVYHDVEEEEKRLLAFFHNIIMVKRNNELFKKGEKSYKMEINHMSDMVCFD